MVVFQGLVIALVALILLPGYSFYFDVTPKLVVLLAGTAGLLVWSAVRFRTAPRWFSTLVVLSLASLLVSTAASRDLVLSTYGTIWRRFGALSQVSILAFAWILAAHTSGRPDRIRTVLRAITVSGLVSAVYGICQYAGWDPLLNPAVYHIGEGIWTIVRPPGTLGYVSYFASWLVFVVFLSMALAHMDDNRRWRTFARYTSGLSLVALLLTGTRAALAGIVVGCCFELYSRGAFRITRRGVAALVISAVMASALWFSPIGWPLHSRLRWISEDPWGGARPGLWQDGLKMAMAHPVLGFGPETFQASFPHYESAALARAYPDFTHESPHNMFLDAFIAQGLPGLALTILLCVVGLRRSAPWLGATVAAAIACQQFSVFNLPTALLFYSTIALVAAITAPEAQARRSWLIPLAVPAATCLIWLCVRFAAADHQLALARRSLDSRNLAAATQHYEYYEHLQPGHTTADLWFSRALLGFAPHATTPSERVQSLTLAGAAALRSIKTAEDPFNAWFNTAILWATQNNRQAAEEALRSAIAAHPRWFKPHWALARLLSDGSHRGEAEREAALAAYLDGDKHPEVLQTLKMIGAYQDGPTTSGLRK